MVRSETQQYDEFDIHYHREKITKRINDIIRISRAIEHHRQKIKEIKQRGWYKMSGEVMDSAEFEVIDLKDFTWVKYGLEKYWKWQLAQLKGALLKGRKEIVYSVLIADRVGEGSALPIS